MKVTWLSYFPVEWLPDAPEAVRRLPRQHAASWQRVLIEEFAEEPGLDLHVIAVRKQFPRSFDFKWRGIQFHCLKVPGGVRTLSLFWWETVLIRRLLKTIKPDLVHAWGVERGAALVASRLHYPYLVTIQGLLRWIYQQTQPTWRQRFEMSLERPALGRASVVTTESSFGVNWLSSEYPHLKIIQAEHAPSWIYHRIYRKPDTKPPKFLYVGGISPGKGADILLEGLDGLQSEMDFRMTIVGGGRPEFIENLRGRTSESLWRRITLRKGLTPAEVAEEMASAAIMLYPTRADTSPNSVKEAVAAGLPVVASEVGGIPDYLKHEKNGLTFRPNSREAFVTAVRNAVRHPMLGAGRVDRETHIEMRKYLSPTVMRARFLLAYQTALSTR